MKKMIVMALLSLTSATAFSSPVIHFYECGGFGGVDEYRVGINLNLKTAGFFDNDNISYMNLTEVETLKSNPPQIRMIFQGEDISSPGEFLKLYFNLTKKTASLYSIDKGGKLTKIGSAACVRSQPWGHD